MFGHFAFTALSAHVWSVYCMSDAGGSVILCAKKNTFNNHIKLKITDYSLRCAKHAVFLK